MTPDPPGTVPGLRVQGLTHAYGRRTVVRDLDLAIAPGEVHCLVGPSGCGKTTTLRLIAGLEAIQAGGVTLNGRLLAAPGRELPPERRRVGLMFQDFALFPHLDVAANVGFGLSGMARREREARVAGLLATVNMTRWAREYPHTLSGGEQQRVALARALAPTPELMLLDEAFSALDTALRAQVREEGLELLRRTGTPTLLVTHDADEAIRVGDRIHAMLDGRVIQSGTAAELYAAPADAFVAGFFGPVNRLSGRVEDGAVRTGLGAVPAGALRDGDAALVVVRPEAIRLSPHRSDPAVCATVIDRRDLGPVNIVRLGLADGTTVQVRQAGLVVAEAGQRVDIELDPGHLFVYPAAGPGPGGI